jgi:hypothetical protein
MTALAFTTLFAVFVLAAASGTSVWRGEALGSEVLRGACYCRAEGALQCTADLSEAECRRRCEESFCDDWFWKERLPCWNWGYGG